MKILIFPILVFYSLSFGSILAVEKIDINTASYGELQEIKGVGPIIAQKIINARPFFSLDDLIKVSGIGETKLEDIKNQGLAWVDIPEAEADENSSLPPELESEATSSPAKELTKDNPLFIIYPAGVIINEILPYPVGSDAEEEWIEIFNQNNIQVDLSGWKINDTMGGVKVYILPEGTKIGPRGFLVLSRPTTKITLNNDADGIELSHPDGKIIDSISYTKASHGKTLNRIDNEWSWSSTLTPGSVNIISAPEEKTESHLLEDISRPQDMAAISEQFFQSSNTGLIVFVALALSVFSGATILLLKKKTGS